MEDRVQHLIKSREYFNGVKNNAVRILVQRTPRSDMPSVSCVIPCRGPERQKAIDTVIACVKGQSFPVIEILVVEQDEAEKIRLNQFAARRLFVKSPRGQPFCKAAAFNRGVAEAKFPLLVLQDADIIFHRNYLKKLFDAMRGNQGSHIGKEVIYMDGASTNEITSNFKVNESLKSSQIVGYFEGGSLACTKQAYFSCGGFLEEFIGYGCEDCDFFNRLKHLGRFWDERTEAFIHLDHGRPPEWKNIHAKNKKFFASLKIGHNLTDLSAYCRTKLRTSGYAPLMDSLGA
jgi:glycosyltransferase involved in cell wall biosynthesis